MLDDNGPSILSPCFQQLDRYVSIRAENSYTKNAEIRITVWNLYCSGGAVLTGSTLKDSIRGASVFRTNACRTPASAAGNFRLAALLILGASGHRVLRNILLLPDALSHVPRAELQRS